MSKMEKRDDDKNILIRARSKILVKNSDPGCKERAR